MMDGPSRHVSFADKRNSEDQAMRPVAKRARRGVIVGLFCLATLWADSRGAFAQKDAGQPWVNSIGMKLTFIPAGEFQMGSRLSSAQIARRFGLKAEDYENEHPLHRVKITNPFYLGVHEVTVGQFHKFVSATGDKTEPERDGKGGYGWNESKEKFEGRNPKYNWRNTGWKQTDEHPVVNVTWNDAVGFCEWLSRKDGRKYRLPTEAEWEYACRAGTTSLYQSGDDSESLARVGNLADGTAKAKLANSSSWTYIRARDGYVFTAPAGKFQPNAFGLFDMHGNVWEWCSDWYGKDYYGQSPVTDPQGPSSGTSRALRGAAWGSNPQRMRSAGRDRRGSGDRNYSIGFRVVGVLE
jgi:formylglycine-generating enzyme required for sulfatase activity